jgi:hypothetical protein
LIVKIDEFVPSADWLALSIRLGGARDAVGPEGETNVARLTVPEYLPEPIRVITIELSVDPGLSANAVFVELMAKSPRTLTWTVDV